MAHQHPSKDKELRKVTREASSKRFRIQECNYKNSSDYLKTITHKSERESNKSIRNFNSSNITKYHQDLSAYTEKPMRI